MAKSGDKKNGNGKRAEGKVRGEQETAVAQESTNGSATDKGNNSKFPIVGVGASAGGLEAFELFFRNLPSDINASFVLIQHLGTEQPSILRDLLERFTRLPVQEAKEGMKIELNHVYVIPVKVYMAVEGGVLKLTERSGVRPHVPMPIDFFFRSLAKECAEKAVAVILSGTGTDGTLGFRDINGAGGVTVAQDLSDARFPGMPESAINSGHVDYVLPAAKMGAQLKSILDRLQPSPARKPSAQPAQQLENVLGRILSLVRLQTHHDFSHYKKSTIVRRIERRMLLHAISDADGYVNYLEQNKEEVHLLFNEFLIRVTSFFRDPEAFDALKRDILPRLLEGKQDDYAIRIWVPGCSTGEEAYSIAMAFYEYLDEHKRGNELQIFGTDIDSQAVERARTGAYPANIAGDVSEERLRRFFIREEAGYRVKKDIREKIVFAVQDLIKDPPFTRLDLLSCRNVLIYMDTELQNRIIPLFHYSLKPTGALLLGPSEGVASFSDLFTVIDRKWKVFEARSTVVARPVLPESFSWTPFHGRPKEQAISKPNEVVIADVIRRRLLRSFTPPAVVVDERGTIVFIQGETGEFLQPAEGTPQMNLFDMAREGMRAEVRLAVSSARDQKKEVVYRDLPVRTNGEIQRTNLRVAPLAEPGTDGLLLVVFEPLKTPPEKETSGKRGKSKHDARILEHLQEELRLTKEHLQATVEELQSSNEELRSANEELQSTNEEVQSTNEELETSREELQSVNEELVTVNAELQSKIEQLSRTEVDMKNLFEGMKIATVFVDSDLRVVRFTEEATKLINLITSDVGRPLADIVTKLKYKRMIDDARDVLRTLQYKETDVQIENGDWYHMRIMPYKNQEHLVQGVVITFGVANELKQIEGLIESVRELAAHMVETSADPFVTLDDELTVVAANAAFCSLFKMSSDGTRGKSLLDIADKYTSGDGLKALLAKEALRRGKIPASAIDFRVGGTLHKLQVSGWRIEARNKQLPSVMLTFRVEK
jgi:two-component system CheB/CheR fusion protein